MPTENISKILKDMMKEEEKLLKKVQESLNQEMKVYQQYLKLEKAMKPEFLRKYVIAAVQYRSHLLQYYNWLESILNSFQQLISLIEENERKLQRERKAIEPQLKQLYEAEEKELEKLVKMEKATQKEVEERLKQSEKRLEELLKLQKKLAKDLQDQQMKGHGKESKKVRDYIQRIQQAAQEYQELSRQIEQIRKGKLLIPITLKGQEEEIRREYAMKARQLRGRVQEAEMQYHNLLMELFYHISTIFSQSIHPLNLATLEKELKKMGCPEETMNEILTMITTS